MSQYCDECGELPGKTVNCYACKNYLIDELIFEEQKAAERQRQEAECLNWLEQHPDAQQVKSVNGWTIYEFGPLPIGEGPTLQAAILSARQEAGKKDGEL